MDRYGMGVSLVNLLGLTRYPFMFARRISIYIFALN